MLFPDRLDVELAYQSSNKSIARAIENGCIALFERKKKMEC
jgi:hypothetical protein